MAVKMNLLPPEYTTSGTLAKFLKASKALGVIALGVFIVFTVGISAFLVFSTITLNNLNSDVNSLKTQITAEEQTETQIVLLKDRLSKIKKVLADDNVAKNLKSSEPVISLLGPNANLTQLDVGESKVDLSASFTASSDMAKFIQAVSATTSFKTINSTGISFSPNVGYIVGLSMLVN